MWITEKRLREIIREEIDRQQDLLKIMTESVAVNPLALNKDNSPMGPGERKV